MRQDTVLFRQKNDTKQKRPRYVVEIAFDTGATILRYFTSHSDSALPAGAVAVLGVFKDPSGTSQDLKPDQASASIGTLSFTLVDKAGQVTIALGGQLALGRSTRLQRVRLYVGYEGLLWSDYSLVYTQLVQDVSYANGAYKVRCLDVQRYLRTEVFDVATTRLTASLLASGASINVISTSLFSPVEHGSSFTDAPGSTVFYIRIEDEIIRCSSKTSTTFTVDTGGRGALNTLAADHLIDPSQSVDRLTEVKEYTYLEMPALKALYAILTGAILGTDNLLPRSEELDNAAWSKANTTISANATTAPDGTVTADKLVEAANSNSHSIAQTLSKSASVITYSFSVYVKPSGRDWIAVQIQDGVTAFATVYFNVTTGVIGNTIGSATMEPAENGFYRCAVSGISTTVTSVIAVVYLTLADAGSSSYAGDGSSGVYLWGAQLNAAALPALPYAKTTTVARTQAALPTTWHLGVAKQYVRLDDFLNKHDLWDPLDDTSGFMALLQDLKKTDGKKFCEEELSRLLGVFQPVGADGALGCKRMAKILTGAAYVALLDESNVVSYGDLLHDFGSMHNVIQYDWNWDPFQGDKGEFTRSNVLIDAGSRAIYGKSDTLKLQQRALHGSIHSSAMLQNRFDALRDRYSAPPFRIDVATLAAMNQIEVGDVVRVKLRNVRDYVASDNAEVASFDRSVEVQNVSIDWQSGALKLKLMGTSRSPDAVPATDDATVLPGAFYTSKGTLLSSVLTVSSNHVTADGVLQGSGSMENSIFYHNSDLTFDATKVVQLKGNIYLRINGVLQINGTLYGNGLGLAGAARMLLSQFTLPGTAQANFGTSGFLGNTESEGGINSPPQPLGFISGIRGNVVLGKNPSMPSFDVSWDGIELLGLPVDLRGSSGSGGAPTWTYPKREGGFRVAPGEAGGNGGAGLMIVCKGLAFGVSGKIDLSGGDGNAQFAGADVNGFYPDGSTGALGILFAGAGAGGAPGGLLVVLDGNLATATGISDATFKAFYGRTKLGAADRMVASSSDFRATVAPLQPSSGAVRSWYQGTGNGTPEQGGITDFELPNLSGIRGGSGVQYITNNSAPAADAPAQDVVLQNLADVFLLNNWTRQVTDSTQNLQSVRFLSGAPYPWACGGTSSPGDIVVSKDSTRWERKTNPTSGAVSDFAWNGSAYVAVGGTGTTNLLLRSTDGVTWTQQTVPDATVILTGVAWFPEAGLFVAGGITGSTRVIWTSPTGVTWTNRTTANNGTGSVWAANGRVVAGGQAGGNALIQYSTDGINWTAATIDTPGGWGVGDFAYGNGVWVAVGGENRSAFSMDNGVTWTNVVLPSPFRSGVGATRTVAFSGQVFAVAGVSDTGTAQGALAASRDGQIWTPCHGLATDARGITWGTNTVGDETGGHWVAVGNAEVGTGYIANSIKK